MEKSWNFSSEIWETPCLSRVHIENYCECILNCHQLLVESQVACHHPNIWKFLEFLKKEQNFNEILTEQSNIQKKKYRDCAKRLQRLVSNFNANDILQWYCI